MYKYVYTRIHSAAVPRGKKRIYVEGRKIKQSQWSRDFLSIYLAEIGVVADLTAGAILELSGGGGSLEGSKIISTFIGLSAGWNE